MYYKVFIMLLYSTFVPGLQTAVAELSGKPTLLLDGAVLYEAEALDDAPWAFNTFQVLAWEKGEKTLNRFMKKVCSMPLSLPREISAKDFRIVTSEANRLVSVDPNIKKQVEGLIQKRTGLLPERGGSGLEFWFLTRSEGYVFFMKRLTYRRAYDKTLPKGALTPPLAYMLNYLAKPEEGDTLLDPFCGSGAIGKAARAYFHYGKVYESDIQGKNGFKTCGINALPDWLAHGSVDRIVTDPPWGLFDGDVDIKNLYETMLDIFSRLLKPGGKIVVLTAQKELMDSLTTAVLPETYNILVSGKKAGIYLFTLP
jgi:16S rRNA G966 N2-methylase RsmD